MRVRAYKNNKLNRLTNDKYVTETVDFQTGLLALQRRLNIFSTDRKDLKIR